MELAWEKTENKQIYKYLNGDDVGYGDDGDGDDDGEDGDDGGDGDNCGDDVERSLIDVDAK